MNQQVQSEKQVEISPSCEKNICRLCKEEIHEGASKCYHCGAYQSRWNWLIHTPMFISFVMMCVAIAQAILGYTQLNEAKRERILASKAFEKAEQAETTARSSATEVQELSRDARNQVSQIKTFVETARQSLDSIKSVSEFSLLLAKAKNDNRPSFDALRKIAKNKEHKFHDIANQALIQIITDPQVTGLLTYNIDWKKDHNIDPAKASLNDFAKIFSREISIRQPSVLTTMWQQTRFPKAEKLQALYEVITTTNSLRCLHEACRLMDEEAKLGKNILAYELYAEWWGKNRSSYQKRSEVQPTDSLDKK